MSSGSGTLLFTLARLAQLLTSLKLPAQGLSFQTPNQTETEVKLSQGFTSRTRTSLLLCHLLTGRHTESQTPIEGWLLLLARRRQNVVVRRTSNSSVKLEHNVDDGSMVLRDLVLMIAADAGVHFGLVISRLRSGIRKVGHVTFTHIGIRHVRIFNVKVYLFIVGVYTSYVEG